MPYSLLRFNAIMYNSRNIFKLCFVFWIGLSIANGQCPSNEVPSECEDTCNTCDGDQICPEWCIPGCQCLPGYSRDSNFNCIPKQFCTGSPGRISLKPDPEVSRLLSWENNKKGCPDEIQCKKNCQQESPNFDGICTGPNKKHCQCYICKAPSPITDAVPTSGGTEGCPNLIKCFRSCTKRGFSSGQCIGPQRLNCQCQNRPREASDSLLSPTTIRGGCPVRSLCLAFCQGRGFNSGICLGPKSELCNCFSSATPPRPLPGPPGGSLPAPIGGSLPAPVGGPLPVGGLLSPNTVRGGCPIKSLCLAFCQSRGLNNGICLGPRNELCNCFSGGLPPVPALPPQIQPPVTNYRRPSPPVPVQPPAHAPPPAHAFPPTSCPNIALCVLNCRSQGKVAGFCTGVARRKCECV
ncbi:uncharacterized protein [Parasteatoda tepidariorum]|uniref:uncharacterized protein n=1 Tax=Parasteatoda tepidariorum TaxID=114398 RepID=UPI001C7249C2|nr:uncharacterized protein LOC107440604 [Parasteatoda tepidariorum]